MKVCECVWFHWSLFYDNCSEPFNITMAHSVPCMHLYMIHSLLCTGWRISYTICPSVSVSEAALCQIELFPGREALASLGVSFHSAIQDPFFGCLCLVLLKPQDCGWVCHCSLCWPGCWFHLRQLSCFWCATFCLMFLLLTGCTLCVSIWQSHLVIFSWP